ncbi:MAG: hypothetical protein JKY80_07080, partial [Mariprofundaceae bacterium]|nr:hypothetical protein [Mariprofundaceae bacterium]
MILKWGEFNQHHTGKNMVTMDDLDDPGGILIIKSFSFGSPLAILSQKPQLLFNYFKQLFAQVTNPAIDSIREELVMSMEVTLGKERNLLDESPEHCRKLKVEHPILTGKEM